MSQDVIVDYIPQGPTLVKFKVAEAIEDDPWS